MMDSSPSKKKIKCHFLLSVKVNFEVLVFFFFFFLFYGHVIGSLEIFIKKSAGDSNAHCYIEFLKDILVWFPSKKCTHILSPISGK